MRRLKKHYSFLVSLIMVLTISLSNITVNAASNNKRLWGTDRYKTGAAVVEDGWSSSEHAILVNGENYPDSLSAAVLAKKYNAPLILTKNNVLESNSKQQLQRLGVKNVYIVGGDFVVKPNVEKDLKSLGITTERISGKDRYSTSADVAKKIGTDNGIILATGLDYADALSIAPIAAKLQMPILLVPKDNVPEPIASFINGKSIPVTYVIGGTDVISDKVVNDFPNVKRIIGNDNYERNINIIKAFEDKLDFGNVVIASGEGFADALSGSAYAAIGNNPIILIGKNPTAVTKDFVKSKDLKNLTILGGASVISDISLDNLYSDKEQHDFEEVTVTKNVDGDTIEVTHKNGAKSRVRFIGVNTPESTTKTERYGKEASEYTKSELMGKTIYLEKDVSETDRYSRLLRYIWLEKPSEISDNEIRSKMFNAILVLSGYAQQSTYPPDVKYSSYFGKYAVEARSANKGLWAIDSNGTTQGDTIKPIEPSNPTEPNKPSQTATVYVTASGKAYHKTSTCSNMKNPKAMSLKEAQSKGYTPCSKCKP